MKRLNKIITSTVILLLCTIGFSSCSDSIFDTSPKGSFDESAFWHSETDIKSWMAGIYSSIQQALGENYVLWGEARSDNFHPTIYGGETYQYKALLSTNSACKWTDLYTVIARCNMGLENIDRITSISETNMAIYKGQMHTIRAWMYFYAIRVWGDVPMILHTWNGSDDTKYNPRIAVATIKEEVLEKDLKTAIEMLPVDVTTVTPNGENGNKCFYFNKAGALALRMDVDLWFKNNYQRVIDDADMIEACNLYKLVTNATQWRDIFLAPGSSTETIFTLNWNYALNGYNPYGRQLSVQDQNPMFCVSSETFRLMLRDKNDVRLWGVIDTLKLYNDAGRVSLTEQSVQVGAQRGDKVYKFNNMLSGTYGFQTIPRSECEFKLPMYRYADVLLMRAEALNMRDNQGDAQEAINIVNRIRRRCGNNVVASLDDYPVKKGYGANSRQWLILEERQVEFYGEGRRWFDLRRSDDILYTVMDTHLFRQQNYYGAPTEGFPKDGRELFPLHHDVFSTNPLLTGHQNPPYSE